MASPPRIPIYEQVLRPIELLHNSKFRGIVSALVTALKREEHVLISYESKVPQSSISGFVEYVICSIFPA